MWLRGLDKQSGASFMKIELILLLRISDSGRATNAWLIYQLLASMSSTHTKIEAIWICAFMDASPWSWSSI